MITKCVQVESTCIDGAAHERAHVVQCLQTFKQIIGKTPLPCEVDAVTNASSEVNECISHHATFQSLV